MERSKIWTGPALSNPRNKKGETKRGVLNAQDDEVAIPLLTQQFEQLPNLLKIITDNGDEITGTIEISDLAWLRELQEVHFHLWEFPRRGNSSVWRTCYAVEIRLNTGEIVLSEIHIAPDRESDDTEHAPSSAPS